MSAFGSYLYTYASLSLSALLLCSGIFLISCLITRKRSKASPRRQVLWFVTLWYLIALSLILFTTGYSGEGSFNLYPLRSIFAAVADTRVSLWQLLTLTAGIFIPFGLLLTLIIRHRRVQPLVPLIALVYALLLELLQLIFERGTFNLDRPLLSLLGASLGCALAGLIFPQYCGGRRRILHYVEAAAPVALTAALLISYSVRSYGYLPCETGAPYNARRANVDCSAIENELPSRLDVYALVMPSGSAVESADNIFSALGYTRDAAYKNEYDSVLLCRSEDAQALLWYYNDGSFNLTLYSGGPVVEGDVFESVSELIRSLGRSVPDGMTQEESGKNEYRLTASFLQSGDEVYNGSVNFSLNKGRLEYLDYELFPMLRLGSEYTMNADKLANRIRRGDFICSGGVMISGNIEDIQCLSVSIVYDADSKGFYRPMYSIEAAINGGVATILLPAF